MKRILINYIENLESKKIEFKKFSKKILNNMNYMNSKKFDFTLNSGKTISKLIRNFDK